MKNIMVWVLCLFIIAAASPEDGCTPQESAVVSDNGVRRAEADVKPGADGLTIEQKNIRDRLAIDNTPGAIKHLYILSAYSGQVLIYSTVRGKVTSSGKRLTPTTVSSGDGQYVGSAFNGMPVNLYGLDRYTNEVMQDDGTYGSSVEYLYWWDSKGTYHQQYVTGGMILHVSDQPLSVRNVTINMELTNVTPTE